MAARAPRDEAHRQDRLDHRRQQRHRPRRRPPLRRRGGNVAITGRNRATLDEAARGLGANTLALEADAADIPALERAAAQIAERFGGIDIVFANAGIAGATPLGQTTLEMFETILRTNLTGVFFTVQAALPHLRDGASIILNGSVHAVLGFQGSSAYAASKAGVRAMTRNLAAELSPRGIRVNIVVPGATDTPIWAARAPTPDALAALQSRYTRQIPLERFAEADDVARAALFLASDDSANIQAAEIVVDGGTTGAPAGAPVYRQSS